VKRKIGLVINGPNILLGKHSIDLVDILGVLNEFGRIVVGKVVLNKGASTKLVEIVVEYGLEPVVVLGRVDVAVTIESMKLIHNPTIDVLALGVRDAQFVPLLFEAKKLGKEIVIIAPSKKVSDALQNTADKTIKLPTLLDSQLQVLTLFRETKA